MAVLVDHQLAQLCEGKKPVIKLDDGLNPRLFIQPASFDLPLRPQFYSVTAEPDLSGGGTIRDFFLERYRKNCYDVRTWADEPYVALDPGVIYLFEVAGEFRLPSTISGSANAKSSSGRNFLHCKLLVENGGPFDTIPAGYYGGLYVLVSPRRYPVRWQLSETLVQIRLRTNYVQPLSRWELEMIHRENPIVCNQEPVFNEAGLQLTLSVDGDCRNPAILVAQNVGRILNLWDKAKHRPHLYLREPVRDGQGIAFLNHDEVALAHTIERVSIGLNVCAEMQAIDPRYGEIRYHDAGFIDPGFGLSDNPEQNGCNIVCEITNLGQQVQLAHGRKISQLIFEWLDRVPAKPYGQANNNYANQRGIRLAKQFLPWGESHKEH